jgi:hypothetical protein
MLKKYLISIGIIVCSVNLKAQDITPTDLFQVYKYWQMDVVGWDKNTYDYIQTIDKQWGLRLPPQKDDKGLTLLLGYFKDKKWYEDEECRIMLSYDNTLRSPKCVLYRFINQDTWLSYQRQMDIMSAQSLITQPNQGGIQSVYRVNDINIFLTDFPPGINGTDRTYQVMLVHQ